MTETGASPMTRLLLLLTAIVPHPAAAFLTEAPLPPLPRLLAAANDGDSSSSTLSDLKSTILESIRPTKRGLSATPNQRSTIESQIRSLESRCGLSEPARDARMQGGWVVQYTTAPPPSNGQLGPFIGTAKQEIDLDGGGYKNILEVGQNTNKWLTAVLDAQWEEWDGTLLIDKGGGDKWREAVVTLDDEGTSDGNQKAVVSDEPAASGNEAPWSGVFNSLRGVLGANSGNRRTGPSAKPDYGATSWKVDFVSITISLFGIPLFSKKFDEGTSRVWRMSYLDDNTRVVRAGRTGKGEDDVVFYMTRDEVVAK